MSTPARAPGRFGTMGGVFTPSVLTILGVIMFMRAGYVVGHAGIWRALIILALAKAITTLTSLSLAAISTNTEVGPGGNYFMISRTLGPDIGGTVGITLFLSQAVAVTFYVIGFSEALFGLFAGPGTSLGVTLDAYRIPQLVSSATVVCIFLVTFKGADVAMRAQYAILAVLLASVAVMIIGGISAFDSATFDANRSPLNVEGIETIGFWAAFAIFFPAATGIDAGANMSGDLKDPAKSIPNGTFLAIGFTATVYVVLLVLIAGYTDAASLAADPFGELKRMSVFAPLVIAGVFAATLSSALASFLGAPRILQAMGKDKLLKPMIYFAQGHGPADEPRRATVLTLAIALCVVWAGNLNAIAEIISMFFLIAYGMINLSAFVEGRARNPSFRPRFKLFGWPAGLAGAVGAAIAMIKINETYALVSAMLCGLLYVSLRGRTASGWGDAKRGYTFAKTRDNLFDLQESREDAKNWRPRLAVLTDDAERDQDMVECAEWIESKRGILSVLEVLTEPGKSHTERAETRRARSMAIQQRYGARGMEVFADTFVVAEHDDIDGILQAYSIGALRPNTVMMQIPPVDATERRAWLGEAMRAVAPRGVNVVLHKGPRADSRRRRIDLWWSGQTNGSLMAVLTHLICDETGWDRARVRLCRVVTTADEHESATRELRAMVDAARLEMTTEAILSEEPVLEVIARESADADLVVLGMSDRDLWNFDAFLERNEALLGALSRTLFIRSDGAVDLSA